MHFATLSGPAGPTAAVLAQDTWHALPWADLSELLGATTFAEAAALAGGPVPDARPLLPLPRPGKVICCGLNYGDHIRETGRALPEYPTLFPKYADTLTGPDADLVLPRGTQLDWEAELAVVVGAVLRSVDRDTAAAGIAGYTVTNDISVRDWQYRTLEWFQGKAWDASTPAGPVVVTPEEIDPVAGVDVVCRVNGEEVQRGDTGSLVFDAAGLLAYISTFTVLRPGDLVLTGTPGGVGTAREPQWFLADGDVVETSVTGIGTLRNTVRLTG
ncbi:fumarylacetoacetate hydrolase family protein [Streptomyces sp. NPDC047000]|uniref:fumarylacetoacetate hydrolase family protein n=1 Tax=Streptomyces sp. NPDC047000 TaxID=3155474 RepID=UPI0033EF3A1B